MSQTLLESEFLKLRDISQLRDISSKKRKWDGLLIGVLTVNKIFYLFIFKLFVSTVEFYLIIM